MFQSSVIINNHKGKTLQTLNNENINIAYLYKEYYIEQDSIYTKSPD